MPAPRPYRARINERHLLNLPGYHGSAMVGAWLENTESRRLERDDGGRWRNTIVPRAILEISDCATEIELDIDLHSEGRRINALHKVTMLVRAIERFREGLIAEIEIARARDELCERLNNNPPPQEATPQLVDRLLEETIAARACKTNEAQVPPARQRDRREPRPRSRPGRM